MGRPNAGRRSPPPLRRQHLLPAHGHARILRGQSRGRRARDSRLLGHAKPVRRAQFRRAARVPADGGRHLLPGSPPDTRSAGRGRRGDLLRVLPVCVRAPAAHPAADDGRPAVHDAGVPPAHRAAIGRPGRGARRGDDRRRARLRLLRCLRDSDGGLRRARRHDDAGAVDQRIPLARPDHGRDRRRRAGGARRFCRTATSSARRASGDRSTKRCGIRRTGAPTSRARHTRMPGCSITCRGGTMSCFPALSPRSSVSPDSGSRGVRSEGRSWSSTAVWPRSRSGPRSGRRRACIPFCTPRSRCSPGCARRPGSASWSASHCRCWPASRCPRCFAGCATGAAPA